jgi:hypothetical protein
MCCYVAQGTKASKALSTVTCVFVDENAASYAHVNAALRGV